MVKAYLDKKLKLDEFITHKMPLDRINEAFELLKQGKRYIYPLITRSLSAPMRTQ